MKLHPAFKKIIFLFLAIILISNCLQAQQKSSTQIGAKLMVEANNRTDGTAPLTGFELVYKKGKHNGFETGLYYRTQRNSFVVIYDNGTMIYNIPVVAAERFITIPFVYRYESKFINFTGGASIDIFLSWKDKNNSNVGSYSRSSNANAGLVFSVCKDFLLGRRFIAEPEIRFNTILTDGNTYTHSAFGFAFRYKL